MRPYLHVMLNMDWQDLDFDLPVMDGVQWRRAVDTSLPPPEDIAEAGEEIAVMGSAYRVNRRSVVVLVSSQVAV